jgi:hypothetical protein
VKEGARDGRLRLKRNRREEKNGDKCRKKRKRGAEEDSFRLTA